MLAGPAGSLPLSVVLGRLGGRHALEVVAGLVVLPSVPLTLAGGDHGDFVGARAAILALQLDPLGARFVVDTPPLLGAPPAPVLRSIASSDPVGEQRQGQALPSAHQLLQRAEAGALAIRDVFGGTQFPAAHLNPSCGKQRRECTEVSADGHLLNVICSDKDVMQVIANCPIERKCPFYFHNAKICLDGGRDTFMKMIRLHSYNFGGNKVNEAIFLFTYSIS